MKKILSVALALCGGAALITGAGRAASSPAPVTTPTSATTPAPAANPQPGNKFVALMAEKLSLTPEQKSKIDALRQDQRTALDAVATDQSLTDDARRDKIRGIVRSHREQMKAVLTPEQQAKAAQMRRQFMAGPERMQQRRAEELGLSDEQQAKMRQIAFQYHEKGIALRKEMRAELEAVMTPEQKAKAAEMKKRHGPWGRDEHGSDGEKTDKLTGP